MKMASRSIDLISKKKFGRAARFFCLSLPLFYTTTMPFVPTKTSNFLFTHYFLEELSYVLTKDFVSCVHVRFYFFTAAHFHLAASISHFSTAAMKFSCFSSNEIPLLCFQFLALALSLLFT